MCVPSLVGYQPQQLVDSRVAGFSKLFCGLWWSIIFGLSSLVQNRYVAVSSSAEQQMTSLVSAIIIIDQNENSDTSLTPSHLNLKQHLSLPYLRRSS